jgi:enoyl-CoA hydratase/carnithine racemase
VTTQPKYYDVEKEGTIVIWRFYNPPNNLINDQTGPELQQLIQEFYADPELRVAVFTSALPDVPPSVRPMNNVVPKT